MSPTEPVSPATSALERAERLRAEGDFSAAFELDLEALRERLAREPLLDDALLTELHELAGAYHDGGASALAHRLALEWLERALAAFAPGTLERARLWRERGAFLEFYVDDLPGAVDAYEDALDTHEQREANGVSSRSYGDFRADALSALRAALRARMFERARALRARFEARVRRRYGDGPEVLLEAIEPLASSFAEAGDHETAALLYETQLRSLLAEREPPTNGLCFTSLNLAGELLALGRAEQALASAQQALGYGLLWLGPSDPFLEQTRALVARCEAALR